MKMDLVVMSRSSHQPIVESDAFSEQTARLQLWLFFVPLDPDERRRQRFVARSADCTQAQEYGNDQRTGFHRPFIRAPVYNEKGVLSGSSSVAAGIIREARALKRCGQVEVVGAMKQNAQGGATCGDVNTKVM
jgi:hypothetical protein